MVLSNCLASVILSFKTSIVYTFLHRFLFIAFFFDNWVYQHNCCSLYAYLYILWILDIWTYSLLKGVFSLSLYNWCYKLNIAKLSSSSSSSWAELALFKVDLTIQLISSQLYIYTNSAIYPVYSSWIYVSLYYQYSMIIYVSNFSLPILGLCILAFPLYLCHLLL